MGSLGPAVQKVFFEPSEHLWQVWVTILTTTSPLLPSCWGFCVDLGHEASLFCGIQHSAVQWLVAILEFSQEKMGARPSTLPSRVHIIA